MTSVTQPSADGVASGLITSYHYNVLGQRIKTILPDSSETDYEYHPTGEIKKVSGSQSYAVEYTYDLQGRKATMTTQGQAGPAVTTWQYHGQRGWLSGKRYDNNEGPDYTYDAAGKLLTRTWARGITTSYSYNRAGDLTGATYSDSTPAISYQYDRRGRRIETLDASGTRAKCAAKAHGMPLLLKKMHREQLLWSQRRIIAWPKYSSERIKLKVHPLHQPVPGNQAS